MAPAWQLIKRGLEGLVLSSNADSSLISKQERIAEFWGEAFDASESPYAERIRFQGVAGKVIEAVAFTQANSRASVVCVPGKSESFVKYKEWVWQLYFALEVDVYLLDHRCQGLSERLTSDTQMVHTESYLHYVRDFEQFCYRFVPQNKPNLLFAHSMGAATAALFILDNPDFFRCAVFNAPMFRLRSQRLLSFIAQWWVNFQCWLGHDQAYVRGYGSITLEQWMEKMRKSSSSEERLADYRRVVEAHEEQLKTYGISNRWAAEWFSGTRKIRAQAHRYHLPTLLFSAECEASVENDAHYLFTSLAKNVEHHFVFGAEHEIHFERDAIRDPYMQKVIDFYRRFIDLSVRASQEH